MEYNKNQSSSFSANYTYSNNVSNSIYSVLDKYDELVLIEKKVVKIEKFAKENALDIRETLEALLTEKELDIYDDKEAIKERVSRLTKMNAKDKYLYEQLKTGTSGGDGEAFLDTDGRLYYTTNSKQT